MFPGTEKQKILETGLDARGSLVANNLSESIIITISQFNNVVAILLGRFAKWNLRRAADWR